MSTQTINGSIISNYPVFEGSQVLTSDQLNGMFEYLDQQNRFTRSRLIGIGIVCGLHLKTESDQVILSEGIGITSDGFIVKMTDCTMSYRRDYFLPSGVVYEPFGSFDDDNIFTQDDDIILYELLANEPAEGEFQNLTADFFSDKYMLIFLECFDRDPRSCLGKNCEDLGKERIFTTRKLAVNEAGLIRILQKTDGAVENPFFPTSSLSRVDLQKPLFDPDGDESKIYQNFVQKYKDLLYEEGTENAFELLFGGTEATGLLHETYTEFEPLLEPVYNYQNPFEASTLYGNVKSTLRSYLTGSDEENLKGVQYVYEYFELLIATYHHFMNIGAKIAQNCCPQKDFSLHVMLGKIAYDDHKEADEWGILGQSRFRHHFLQPKILNSQEILLKELIMIHKKLLLMVESFQINVIKEITQSGKDNTIKITPIDLEAGAIPRYLNATQNGSVAGTKTTTLETEWDFETTVTGKTPIRVRSYDHNEITHVTLSPAQTGYVDAPLLYRTSFHDFKAEAIFGREIDEVVTGESAIRDQYHLPFTILPVKINPETNDIEVESSYWQDLQTSYNVTKGEINTTTRNLIGDLKAFQRTAEIIDYGSTEVNVYNFKAEVDHVLSEMTKTEGLIEIAESLIVALPIHIDSLHNNGDSPIPFFVFFDDYKVLRRALHKSQLRLRYALEILIHEKIEVLPADIFQVWSRMMNKAIDTITDFLHNNDFYQLYKLYHSFASRYQYLQENHYSVLSNFLKLHPGVDSNAIKNGGTHILVYEKATSGGGDDEVEVETSTVFANFSLPYRLDPNDIEIPLDPALESIKIAPVARGESILLIQGNTWLVDAIANDMEPNGDVLRVDDKGHTNEDNEFISGSSSNGANIVYHGSVNTLLRYEPNGAFNGTDFFEYIIESDSDNSLQDTAYVEVLVASPYRKHIKAIDDLAATDNHHTVTIDVLNNDTSYDGITVIIPETSAFGAPLSLTEDNRVIYTPVHGREGKDSFTYEIQYEFSAGDDATQTETSSAEVEVIVFCCDKVEFEIVCEGNTENFFVLTDRELSEGARLTLINEAGEEVEQITTSNSEIRIASYSGDGEDDETPYLVYAPDKYFKGKESFVYEVIDSEGFIRRVTLQILVMPCTETYLRRTLRDTTGRFYVLEEGQSNLTVFTDRNELTDQIDTQNGRVRVISGDGTSYFEYQPNEGYFGLDFYEFAYRDASGVIHYNTMQVIVDGYEKVRVESTFQDTPTNFDVLSAEMLESGYSVALFIEKEDFVESIATQEEGRATVEDGTIRYEPRTSFIGDDSFSYVILKDGVPFEYGKFYVIIDTNRKVSVEYTLRDLPKDIFVLTQDQIDQGAQVSITTQPAVSGSTVEVVEEGTGTPVLTVASVVEGGSPYIYYIPAEGYIGQDSFGYVIEVGDVKLYGTVYVIVDSNEHIEVVNVFKNKPQLFTLENAGTLEIIEPTRHGTINQIDATQIQYTPENDYLGSDKLKYRVSVGESIQYGTVFFMVTCECNDIVIVGTVTENSEGNPALADVRVEEIDTGNFVLTGGSGVYSMEVSPNARLRFTKNTHDTLELDVAYQTTVNAQLNRKLVTITGTVTNSANDLPIAGAVVTNERGTVTTNESGFYELIVYAGTTISYTADGFIGQTRTSPTDIGVMNVALEPDNVSFSGVVVEAGSGEDVPITNAVYEYGGTSYETSDGRFEFEVPVGTLVTFSADGYESRQITILASQEDVRVELILQELFISVNVIESVFQKLLFGAEVEVEGARFIYDKENYEIRATIKSLLTFRARGFSTVEVNVSQLAIVNGSASYNAVLNPIEIEVKGKVTSSVNGEGISNAVILVNNGRSSETNDSGEYQEKVTVWDLLSVSADGFLITSPPEAVSIYPRTNDPVLDIRNSIITDDNTAVIDFVMTPEIVDEIFEVTGIIYVDGNPSFGEVTNGTMNVSSDEEGFYRIQARVGDVLVYRVPQSFLDQERTVTQNQQTINVSFTSTDQV